MSCITYVIYTIYVMHHIRDIHNRDVYQYYFKIQLILALFINEQTWETSLSNKLDDCNTLSFLIF